jgi:predicted ATPase
MTLRSSLEQVGRRTELDLHLSVYTAETLDQLLTPLESYLSRAKERPRRRLFPIRQREQPARLSPLLLTGPVGTGKTTLMMLLDRAIPEASCAPLFQQEIAAHPSTAQNGGAPEVIEVRPLALMGRTHNLPTGVVRLKHLQRFHRLFTYDRATARTDAEAAERFAHLFRGRIVFIDEFVPDVVSSAPMLVINLLADHGVQVVLSSNRRETPFIEGVQVIHIEGADMRVGDLSKALLPAGPDPRFDQFAAVEPTTYDWIVRGLRARLATVGDQRWMQLRFSEFATLPAEWLAFQHLMQHADRVLVDGVPVFDPTYETGNDAARRFVLLVDALYDERRPVLVRLTNEQPLAPDFDVEQLSDIYLPETLVDLERALSRLRQLAIFNAG